MTKGIKDVGKATATHGRKDWMGIGLDAGETAAVALGLPGAHQAAKTLRYIDRAHDGKVRHPNVWNAIVGGGR
jgi:hypothetical protein